MQTTALERYECQQSVCRCLSNAAEADIQEFTRMNERDFPVPSKPRAQRVAVYGNTVPRWRGQTFINLF